MMMTNQHHTSTRSSTTAVMADNASTALSSITGTQHDDAAFLFATPKVFGRAKESNKLIESFQNVANNHKAQLAVVHGKSGMGKTTLVEESLRKRVCDNHQGYFCTGKFVQEQSTCDGGYSAVMAALSDLCDLVIQAEDFGQRKEVIQNTLGTDAYVLADLISSIHHFFPPEQQGCDVPDYSNIGKTAMTRFKLACKSFLHAMSDANHPVVIFIDDIQWADVGSQQVIATLLEDHELQHVLFVLAYRDEEAEGAATMNLLQHYAHDTTTSFVDIQLESLDIHAIEELLSDQMGLAFPEEVTYELSKLVTTKTMGNPFHVHQYIAFIVAEELLLWSRKTKRWEFDVNAMQQPTMIPDSLVEIIERRMDRLAPSAVKILRLAAMLGFSFEERVLAEVVLRVDRGEQTYCPQPVDASNLGIKEALSLAVREGLIEESTNVGHYMFSHDKLLASFLSRNREHEDPSALHFVIAQCWIDFKGVDDERSFRAAQHANKSSELFTEQYGSLALVTLNLEAANYCTKRSVFFAAAAYLRKGADELDRKGRRWEANYDLSLELHLKLAEVELILGDFAACEWHATEILTHCICEEKKIKAMWYQVMAKVASNEIGGSIIVARDALRKLRVHFPTNVYTVHIARKLLRVRKLLRAKSIDDIINLPMTDAHKIANHRFLVHIAAMSLMEDKEQFTIFAGLVVTESTLTEGLSEFSATGFAIYALAEASMGNYDCSYKYGQTALALTRKLKCLETEISTRTLLSLGVLHWKEPIKNLADPLTKAFSGSFMTGNLWYGALASANALLSSLCCGSNLIILRKQALNYLAKFKEYKQDQLAICLLPTSQCILHFTSTFDYWSDAVKITGEVMNEEDYLEECDRSNYKTLKGDLYTLKLLMAYSFGQLDAAKIILKKLKAAAKVMRLHYLFYTYHFFAGMTNLALYQSEPKNDYLRKARSHKKKLQNLRAVNCPNSEPLVKILELEELSLSASSGPDLQRYESALHEAVQACRDAGLVQHTAIAYERAGFMFAAHNDFPKAETYFDHALDLFKHEWGSIAKYSWLKRQVTNILSDHQQTQQSPLWGTNIEVPATTKPSN
jgi:predicted ATPase